VKFPGRASPWLIELWRASLCTYSMALFSRNRLLAVLVLLATCLYPPQGLVCLLGVLGANAVAMGLKLDPYRLREGLYAVSSLFSLLALTTIYVLNLELAALLLLVCLLNLLVSISLNQLLGQLALPALSLPFVLSIWCVQLAAGQFDALELSDKGIFLQNQLYAYGGGELLALYTLVSDIGFPWLIQDYLVSLGSVFLVFHPLAGLVIALGLIIASRIAFMLSVVGFAIGYAFYWLQGGNPLLVPYEFIGYNFILVALALGGLFFVPGRNLVLLLALVAPLTALLASSLLELLEGTSLAIFSMPYILTTLLTVFSSRLIGERRLFTPMLIYHYSPEKSLYHYQHYAEENRGADYMAFDLPFHGEWRVSQGHEGEFTHKGAWRHAWDFSCLTPKGELFHGDGNQLADYPGYNLPVFAVADGYVVDIRDQVEDNQPGQVNLANNWGNSVVIKHAEGLYSQLSHLKRDSICVYLGQYVLRGARLAQLGNSGRSPAPHIHLQFQATPYAGSPTMPYPLKNYLLREGKGLGLVGCDVPREGDRISNIQPTDLLKQAFSFIPGQRLVWREEGGRTTESNTWEASATSLNQPYLRCLESNAHLYFYYDGKVFQCLSYEGDTSSPLFTFFRAAFKLTLGLYRQLETTSRVPICYLQSGPLAWLHDFVAPFVFLARGEYASRLVESTGQFEPTAVTLESRLRYSLFSRAHERRYFLQLDQGRIAAFGEKQGLTWRCVA